MARVRLAQFAKAFYVGGSEQRVITLLRGLGDEYEVSVGVLHAVGPLVGEVRSMGHALDEFPIRPTLFSPNTLWQVGRLASWLSKRRIQLVHAHDFYSAVLVVPAARLAGCRCIVSRADLLHWHGPLRARVLASLSRHADHVLANAEAVRRFCVEREALRSDDITVVRNGIDLQRFDARQRQPLSGELELPPGVPVVVQVANMSHAVKRQEDTLEALALARREVGRVIGIFVGDGSRRPMLEAMARGLGLGASACFLGIRPDVPAILARATIGVLSSSAEGLSNAVIEKMAAGLPVIVTNVGGNPELVSDGERGRVVPANEPAALAAAIIDLVRAPIRARELGARARKFVERELTLAQMIQGHDQLYRRVLQQSVERPRSCRARPLCFGQFDR